MKIDYVKKSMRVSGPVSVGEVEGGRDGYGKLGMTGKESKKCT
jgi:hypothetical protein